MCFGLLGGAEERPATRSLLFLDFCCSVCVYGVLQRSDMDGCVPTMADFMQRACVRLGASGQPGMRAVPFLRYRMKEGINDIKVRGRQTGEAFDPRLQSGFWLPCVSAFAHSSLCSAAKAGGSEDDTLKKSPAFTHRNLLLFFLVHVFFNSKKQASRL